MADLVVLYQDAACVVAARGRLFVQCITGQITAQRLQQFSQLAALQVRTACAESLFNLTLVDARTARISLDARGEAIGLAASTRGHTACSGVVIDGPGVLTSTMRATVATIWAMARTGYPSCVSSSINEVLPFMLTHMGHSPHSGPRTALTWLEQQTAALFERQRSPGAGAMTGS